MDETGNNPSVSLKTEESKSNECCLSHGTLFRNIIIMSAHFQLLIILSRPGWCGSVD